MEIGQGSHTEHIENSDKDISKYAKYLEALFNVSPKDKLSCTTEDGKIIIKLNSSDKSPTLKEFLNIHTTNEAEKNFSLNNNVLTIGNV